VAPSYVGDVNGDGYGDLFGTTIYLPSSGSAPTVFYGGTNVAALSTLLLTKTAGGPSTLMQTTSAGDMNGDGFADLIVQWGYGNTTPQTELRIFFGGSTLANTPDLSIPGPYADFWTLQYSGRVGDLNRDGFEDIGLVASNGTTNSVVQFFAGAPRPTATAVNVVMTPKTSATYQIAPTGDIDADGFDDALIILSGANYALYRGAITLWTTVSQTWSDTATTSGIGGFDIDHDGYSDFAIGTATMPILYRGSAGGPSAVATGLSRLPGTTVIGSSDHDGDGRPDFIGVSNASDTAIHWAGSDGTTDPRAVLVRLPIGTTFNGRLVR
jgi:hypothetical protein